MEDVNLRLEFHRALDPVAPPAPWLSSAVRHELRTRRLNGRKGQARGSSRAPMRSEWLMPAVAALLVLIVVATLVLVGRALHSEQLVPVKPPPIRGVATSTPIRVDPPTVMDCPAHCWVPTALTQVLPDVIWAIVDAAPSNSIGGSSNIFRTDDAGLHLSLIHI